MKRSSSFGALLDDAIASDEWASLEHSEQAAIFNTVRQRSLHAVEMDNQDGDEKKEKGKPRIPEYHEADTYEPTGFGEGGKFMRNKRKKLKVQHEAIRELDDVNGVELPQFFKGLKVYINGFTAVDGVTLSLRQLVDLLVRHGGEHVSYLDKKSLVTHIVASELTLKKREEFRNYKIATPAWLTESVAAQRLLNYKSYPLDSGSTRKIGYDDERSVMGSATQMNLFSMVSAGKPKERMAPAVRPALEAVRESTPVVSKPPSAAGNQPLSRPPSATGSLPPSRPSSAAGKLSTETHETLSERGERLAEAALAGQAGPSNLFTSRPAPRQSPSKSPKKPNPGEFGGYAAYLPSMARSERTTNLLSDPEWLAKHTSVAEGYVDNYFASSRLHHLSTWKEEFKAYVASLQPESNRPMRKQKLTGTPSDNRTIFHVDFDCFFVSAGLTLQPELRGKPVAVCHGGKGEGMASTSEIASCSYEARAKGVKNGISLGRAREMCPDIVSIPFNFELYNEISKKFYNILLSHATFLQAGSVDEVLMEVKLPPPSPSGSGDPALDLAHAIRAEVLEATKCQVSIGISHNILLARLASRRAKPASAFHLLPDDVDDFLGDLPLRDLPGIGWSNERKMVEELKITTVGDLRRTNQSHLKQVLGPGLGAKFAAFARGVDPAELEASKARQSISAEVNYGIRFTQNTQVQKFLVDLAANLVSRLKPDSLKAAKLTLKIMYRSPSAPVETPKFLGHGVCETLNATQAFNKATDDSGIIGETAWTLLKRMELPPAELRGIGITLAKLEKNGMPVAEGPREKGQGTLNFDAPPAAPPVAAVDKNPAAVILTSSPPSGEAGQLPSVAQGRGAARQRQELQQESSVIVLSESDEEILPARRSRQASSVAPVPALGGGKSKSTKMVDKVPSIFAASKASLSVSTDELDHYGIDSEFFKGLPLSEQRSLLDEYRAAFSPPFNAKKAALKKKAALDAAQPRLRGQSTKPALSAAGASKPVTVMRGPLHLSPGSINDASLKKLGFAPEVFRSLPESIQVEQLQAKQKHVVKGDAKGPVKSTERSRPLGVKVKIRPPLKFNHTSSADGLRDFLECWVSENRDGPVLEDVEDFAGFLGRCAGPQPRALDMELATSLLQWWRMVIEDEFGDGSSLQARDAPDEWWAAYNLAKNRVEREVAEGWAGAALRFV